MKKSTLIIFLILSLFSTTFGKAYIYSNNYEFQGYSFENRINHSSAFIIEEPNSNLLKEISADEYKVLTDFFNTEKFSGIDVPQFFEYVYKGNVVFEKTTVLEKKEIDSLGTLRKSFGNGISDLITDFRLKNREQCSIQEKILVERIKILSEKKLNESIKSNAAMSEVPSREMSDIIYLSRIGFNKAKNVALFYVLHSGSPRTSYWVLMEKSNNTWKIKKAVMDNMIIF